jgi:hypothetical protein
MYIGLSGFAVYVNRPDAITGQKHNTVKYIDWEDAAKCKDYPHCKSCDESAQNNMFTMIFSLCLCLPTIYADYTRSTAETDRNFDKLTGALGGIFGSLSTIVGLIHFGAVCGNDLPDHVNDKATGKEVSLSWDVGNGLHLLMWASILLVIDGIVHLVTPTPEHCWREPEVPEEEKPLKPAATTGEKASDEASITQENDDAKDLPNDDVSKDLSADGGDIEKPAHDPILNDSTPDEENATGEEAPANEHDVDTSS